MAMVLRTQLKTLAVVVIAAAQLAACSPGQPDPGCTEAHPHALTVTTDVKAEERYLGQINACTDKDESATYIFNHSDAVWRLESTAAGTVQVDQLHRDQRHESLREIIRTIHPYAVMTADSAVVVHAAPTEVTWTLATDLTPMAIVHDELVDSLTDVATAQAIELFTHGTPRRHALVTCAVSAYQVAGTDLRNLSSDTPGRQLIEGIGVASSVTECATAWRAADEHANRRVGRTATWDGHVAPRLRNPAFLRTADEQLTLLRRIGRAALILATK